MKFYELVFIIRQDISSLEIDKIIDDFKKIIIDDSGTIEKTEYWGNNTLSYEIANNRKGHYILLCVSAKSKTILELRRKEQLSEDIIRLAVVQVDSISKEPSPILKSKNLETEEVVDVTVNKAN